MEETRNNQGAHVTDTPENEMTTDATTQLQDAQSRIDALEAKLADAKSDLDLEKKRSVQYYRQAIILKNALRAIVDKNSLKPGDVYETILETNGIDLDSLLLYISK